MTTYGVTPTGFVLKDLPTIIQETGADVQGELGAAMDLNPELPMGQLVGVFSGKIAELWELGQALYSLQDVGASQDFVLDAQCESIGLRRAPQSKSAVLGTVNLNAGTTLPAGSQAHVTGQVANTWLSRTAVTNTGPTAANVPCWFDATTYGAVQALAGTLVVIDTPVVGWNSVTNAHDASDAVNGNTIGALRETDTALRTRRQESLAASGSGTTAAIASALNAEISSVGLFANGYATVLENTTNAVDGNGLPPHSFEAIVWDNSTLTDNQIAKVIWDNRDGGFQSYGSSSGTTVDYNGVTQTVAFTRPTPVAMTIAITVKTDSTFDAVNGPTSVKNAIITACTQKFGLSSKVIALFVESQALSVQGVTDVTAFTLNGGSANIQMTSIQIPQFASGTITVTVT